MERLSSAAGQADACDSSGSKTRNHLRSNGGPVRAAVSLCESHRPAQETSGCSEGPLYGERQPVKHATSRGMGDLVPFTSTGHEYDKELARVLSYAGYDW